MSKYNNLKTVIDGITFDSKKEAGRYTQLKLLEKAGKIKDLKLQPSYLLLESCKVEGNTNRAITYKGDFEYIDAQNRIITEDCKGMRTEVYKIKKKLFEAKYGRRIREV